ncbi:hypothetical protein TNCV_1821381 [Trichonephila clavipes]|nr:hypothetical protein TNCV_1821381 [Trichonephila clavipes]
MLGTLGYVIQDPLLVTGQYPVEYGYATVARKQRINRLPLVVAYGLPTACEESTCSASLRLNRFITEDDAGPICHTQVARGRQNPVDTPYDVGSVVSVLAAVGSSQQLRSGLLMLFFEKDKNASQAPEIVYVNYGTDAVTERERASYVQFSFRRFRSDIFDIKNTPRKGRLVFENVDKINEIVEVDRPVSSRSLA